MKISYYNGQFKNDDEITVDYNDRAFYFGDGVYEVVRVYNNEFFTLDEHMDRLVRSASEIGIEGLDRARMVEIVTELNEKNNIDDGSVYIQVSRGIGKRNHAYLANKKPVVLAYMNEISRPTAQMEEGISVITADDYRWLKCHVKSLNLLANVMEKERAIRAGAHETILNREGIVTEGSSTNVFIVKDGVLRTHPANNMILNGITRLEVLKVARDRKIPYEEKAFTVGDLMNAEEVFITSTTQEVTPVTEVDGEVVGDGSKGRITHAIQEGFDEEIHKLNLVK
ncbi:D-amino-acid transaminase [Salinicoccus hispanicus]|uniref:D-alanine aminotransferase n=1 Tax=Salinicoccus hispanicus TaxID=157225 RepID=A0A6N8TX47_9STAP|nr:D-amino-acid transaminase [Salinicoccus hispanicus]MXQ50518.1 D-amino-acid transaminase [Salinicoccus hispanicus]